MSYILDALKKSEQARGGHKTSKLLGNHVKEPAILSKSLRRGRWPYLIAIILLLNIGVFAWRLGPWQTTDQPARPLGPSGKQLTADNMKIPEIPERGSLSAQQPAAIVLHPPLAQPEESPAEAVSPPAPEAVKDDSKAVSVNETRSADANQIAGDNIAYSGQEAVQSPKIEPVQIQPIQADPTRTLSAQTDQVQAEQIRTEQAGTEQATAPPEQAAPPVQAGSPEQAASPGTGEPASERADISKAPWKRKAAEKKENAGSPGLPGGSKKMAHANQPARPAASSGIISDVQPLAELSQSSGKSSTLLRWHELVPKIRDSIPNLSFSMLIYSKQPEQRWININGSKRREGDEISSGLKLEEITPDGAVFTYQGQRFFKSVVGD
jgi:general secretion pathway protein B